MQERTEKKFRELFKIDNETVVNKKLLKRYEDAFNRVVVNSRKNIYNFKGKEMEIIFKLFFEEKTLVEIAEELGITYQRVNQLEKSAIKRIEHEGVDYILDKVKAE